LGGICLVLTIVAPGFADPANIQMVLRQISFNTVLAVGMTFVILTAGIDLSVGSVLGLAECVLAWVMVKADLAAPAQVPAGMLAGLTVGAFCGLVNGFLVTAVRVPPFIATLGLMSAARGMALVITGGFSISPLPSAFKFFGQGMLLGWIPVPALIAGAVAAVGWVILRYTPSGRYVYAIGGNEEAARLSGVPVARCKLGVYTFCGLLAGLTGLLLGARLGSARPTDGLGYELDAIAAVVIGGTSLMGGKGSVGQSVIGAAIMGVLRNGLVLLDVSAFWQQVIIGAVIVLAFYKIFAPVGRLGLFIF